MYSDMHKSHKASLNSLDRVVHLWEDCCKQQWEKKKSSLFCLSFAACLQLYKPAARLQLQRGDCQVSERTPNIFAVKWTAPLRSNPFSDAQNTLELSPCFVTGCPSRLWIDVFIRNDWNRPVVLGIGARWISSLNEKPTGRSARTHCLPTQPFVGPSMCLEGVDNQDQVTSTNTGERRWCMRHQQQPL